MDTKIITRAALLLALTLVFQSLRLMIPIPPLVSTFIIGSLVNTCLLLALTTSGKGPALVIAVVAPVVAYLQQLLPLPVFILPIAGGNILFVYLFALLSKQRWAAIISAAGAKTLFLYYSFLYLLDFIMIPSKIAAGLLFVMSWPQFITGVIGGVLATIITKRLFAIHKA